MPLDQVHEQSNKQVKTSVGAVGLTSAFRRWMIAGPEQARLWTEFEVQFVCSDEETKLPHHEQNQSVQDLFHKHVQDLCATISDMGNPFLEKYPELLTLYTRHCASDSVIETVRTIKDVGLSQYKNYVKDVLVSTTSSIHHPIKKNSIWKNFFHMKTTHGPHQYLIMANYISPLRSLNY